MITTVLLLLFLGFLVFGPRKTIEISQSVGRALAQVKNATNKFQSQMSGEVLTQNRAEAEQADK
jgi:Sec-independent protein translocase protein TatA